MGGFLVIGIGNTLRRDDGAGWFFAEALTEHLRAVGLSVHLELHHQLTPELAVDVADQAPSHIIFVDASIAVEQATLTPIDAAQLGSPVTHSLTPAALLVLAHRLYAVDAAGWLIEVPARDLGHGEGLSEAAQRGLSDVLAIAANLHAQTAS